MRSFAIRVLGLFLFLLFENGAVAQDRSPGDFSAAGWWSVEVALFDAAEALDEKQREAVRNCGQAGISSLARDLGFDGTLESADATRLYYEISVLPTGDGFAGYLTVAVKASDGSLAGPVDGLDPEVLAEDVDGLCVAVQTAPRELRIAAR